MRCTRCSGLMIQAEFREHTHRIPCRRCLNCGDYTDSFIRNNRSLIVLPERSWPQMPAYDPERMIARRRARIERELRGAMHKAALIIV